MKLALITETFPPQINGVSRTLGQLADFMVAQGHELLVIQPEYQEKKSVLRKPSNLTIVSLPAIALPFYKEIVVPRPPYGVMRTVLNDFQPDLVHIATEAVLGYSALRFCRKKNFPVVSSFHTNFDAYAQHYRVSWLVPMVSRYLRWFHNQTIETYVPSRTIINRLESIGFERLKCWPRGVDARLFAPNRPGAAKIREELGIPKGAFVVGHCGRLAPEKNFEYLEQVFQKFLAIRPSDHVLVVGDGPSRNSLEMKLKSDPQIAGRIHFTGYKTGELLADCYSAMNAFAFASLTETFGNVILEAMASGLAVVALAEGGPVDVIQNEVTGTLLNSSAGPELMVKQLEEWSIHRDKTDAFGMAARDYAKTQIWNSIMGQLEREYLHIFSQQKK
ncbi:MAG: glycosyltransferase family 4 protein [Isosphaeraceae bacterium]